MNVNYARKIGALMFCGILMIPFSGSAYAWGWHRDHHRRPHEVIVLPFRHDVIVVGGNPYHYHSGRFYRKGFFGFELVFPPIGAVITTLPSGFKTVIVGSSRYYYYDDVYYMNCPTGYIVVPDPTVHAAGNTAVVSASALAADPAVGDSVYVNVPNSNGSYTAVKLTKNSTGYTGPQGEIYPNHPTVSQLKVLYGN